MLSNTGQSSQTCARNLYASWISYSEQRALTLQDDIKIMDVLVDDKLLDQLGRVFNFTLVTVIFNLYACTCIYIQGAHDKNPSICIKLVAVL